MKEYEIHVFASYMVNGEKKYNCFKEYISATNEIEAKKALKAELKEKGYRNIKMEAIAC